MLLLAVNIGLNQSVVAAAIRSLQDSRSVGCSRQNDAGQQCCTALPVPYLTGEYGLWRSMGWGVVLGARQYFILFCLAIRMESTSTFIATVNTVSFSLTPPRSRPKNDLSRVGISFKIVLQIQACNYEQNFSYDNSFSSSYFIRCFLKEFL